VLKRVKERLTPRSLQCNTLHNFHTEMHCAGHVQFPQWCQLLPFIHVRNTAEHTPQQAPCLKKGSFHSHESAKPSMRTKAIPAADWKL
jgi:hypothetical protein